jgi:hypothetical protein
VAPHKKVYYTEECKLFSKIVKRSKKKTFTDPGFCPGTGTPEIGGLTSIQAIEVSHEKGAVS